MELSPSDKRIKQLMEQCGYPNSMSLYQAFKQLEMEVRLDCAPKPQPEPAHCNGGYARSFDEPCVCGARGKEFCQAKFT